jgi:hypothetical protein
MDTSLSYLNYFIFVMILNLIPADISSFTITGANDRNSRFTKQSDGYWHLTDPREPSLEPFYVSGTKVTIKKGSNEQTFDMAKAPGIAQNMDWKSLKEIKLNGVLFDIQQKADGLDLIPKEGEAKHIKPLPQTILKVRWKTND